MDTLLSSGANSPFVWPLLAMAALTMVMWIWMYVVRIGYMQKNRIDPESLKSSKGKLQLDGPQNWPAENYNHLFEMPVLFYVVCLLLIVTGQNSDVSVGLAWAFVVLRAVHSLIHVTSNKIMTRFKLFVLSSLVLFALMIKTAIDLM